MEGVSTQTIERPRIDDQSTTDNDRPKLFHYVKKNEIAESAIGGARIQTLCGEWLVVGQTARPGSPVCPKCEEIYQTLRKR